MKIAVVGATGMVGRTFLKVLEEEKIKADYFLFASERSAGKQLELLGKNLTIIELTADNLRKVKPDYALFSAGGTMSLEFAPVCVEMGCVVIDNSSAFRQDDTVPLIVPECNPMDIKADTKIIANPNCSTIPCMVALKPLDDVYKLKRVVYSTYQAVSGAGQAGVDDYHTGLKQSYRKHYERTKCECAELKKFPYPIISNLIPQIDSFMDNGNTKEEEKMINETRKILRNKKIAVSATTVRVPIENCHSISINAEFEKDINIDKVREILKNAPGVTMCDDPATQTYPMPILADDNNKVLVGRVRLDHGHPNTVNLFVVSDNIRKGAATNAVQILKLFLKS
jgi:aspartate-semialdehyde dehydrogenase